MKRHHVLYLLAIVGGAVTWALVAQASGRREAWDSPLYFSVAIPLTCGLSFVLALLEPARSWRWGILPLAGQLLWMLISQGPGNLLPLGVIVFGIFSIPSVVTARLGSSIATKRTRRDEP